MISDFGLSADLGWRRARHRGISLDQLVKAKAPPGIAGEPSEAHLICFWDLFSIFSETAVAALNVSNSKNMNFTSFKHVTKIQVFFAVVVERDKFVNMTYNRITNRAFISVCAQWVHAHCKPSPRAFSGLESEVHHLLL